MTHAETPPELPQVSRKTLILGLGNVLLGDEGVGGFAVRRLAAESPADAALVFLDGGTLSFTLATPIAECPRLIAIDAAVMGDPPGTVRLFEGDAMDRQLSRHATSIHEVSLGELLNMARLTDTLPDRRALIGIEPAVVDWGDTLTPVVEAALPHVLEQVHALLARWDADEVAPH